MPCSVGRCPATAGRAKAVAVTFDEVEFEFAGDDGNEAVGGEARQYAGEDGAWIERARIAIGLKQA